MIMGAEQVLATSPFISSKETNAASEWWTSGSMLLLDIVGLSAVYWVAVLLRRPITPGDTRFYLEVFPGVSFFIVAFATSGLYPGVLIHPAEEMRRVFHCVTAVVLLVLCTTFLWHNAESYSRSIMIMIWALGSPAVLLGRKLGRHILSRYGWWGVSAVVFGSGATLSRVLSTLQD